MAQLLTGMVSTSEKIAASLSATPPVIDISVLAMNVFRLLAAVTGLRRVHHIAGRARSSVTLKWTRVTAG